MKEEIKHFKSLLRQGSLRHMNILLDDKFQKELQTIIEDYEKLQQENEKLKDNWIKLKEYIRKNIIYADVGMKILDSSPLEDYMQGLEQGSDSNE
mgnify:FL=1|jgi:hypothetical protein